MKNFRKNTKLAFTLAEVVVVMAILGVMMAAFAPVITKRTIAAGSNMFRNFSTDSGHTGIYYGTTGDKKNVLIGNTEISASTTPKLHITANKFADEGNNVITPHLAFATNEDGNITNAGQLIVKKSNDETYGSVVLGGKKDANYKIANLKDVLILGMNACSSLEDKSNIQNIICIGPNAGSGIADHPQSNKIYIGTGSLYASDIYFGTHNLERVLEESGITATPSDIRLKNVGKEFDGGINELNQLTFYNFTYKRDANKEPKVGVMAQDLQKVFPNAVKENQDGYLYIRKDDMFYAAINAIKELFQKITDNSEKIKALEERNAMLEQQNKELQDLYIELSQRVEKLDKKKTKGKLTVTPEKVENTDTETTPEVPEE